MLLERGAGRTGGKLKETQRRSLGCRNNRGREKYLGEIQTMRESESGR